MVNKLDTINNTAIVRGVVVSTKDPENRGRIKVRIPSYHGIPQSGRSYTTDEQLPWCIPGLFASGGNDLGQRIVPVVGTRVLVLFEEGDLGRPVYLGGIPQQIGGDKVYNKGNTDVFGGGVLINTDDTMRDFDASSNPSSQGVLFKSLKGFTIYYNDTDGHEVVKIISQAGQIIKMESLETVTTRRGTNEVADYSSRITISNGDKQDIIMEDDKILLTIGEVELELDETNGVTFYI